MPTKLVYVSPEHYCTSEALDILSPKQLNTLLEEGYDVISRKKVTIAHPKTKKQVKVEHIQIATKSEERGVSTKRTRAEAEDDAPGGELALSRQPDNGSFLGSGSAFSDIIRRTGVGVASNMGPDAAYGMGVDAAKLGGTAGDCPFPRGTIPNREWMKGFAAGGGDAPVASSPEALAEAKQYGKTAAKGPKDLEVTCPYPQGTDLFDAWLEAYEKAGGRVE
jgi:hypothetical protein